MPSDTHTTATVRLQLDLSGLVTQLRELADTLEAANVKRYDHEPDIPTACENCNTTYAGCDERLAILGRTCCKPCEVRDTHKAVAWEMWRWQDRQARPNDDPEAAS